MCFAVVGEGEGAESLKERIREGEVKGSFFRGPRPCSRIGGEPGEAGEVNLAAKRRGWICFNPRSILRTPYLYRI
jgi:hypothetical protein